jgi:hypothetical protein
MANTEQQSGMNFSYTVISRIWHADSGRSPVRAEPRIAASHTPGYVVVNRQHRRRDWLERAKARLKQKITRRFRKIICAIQGERHAVFHEHRALRQGTRHTVVAKTIAVKQRADGATSSPRPPKRRPSAAA